MQDNPPFVRLPDCGQCSQSPKKEMRLPRAEYTTKL